LAETSDFIMLVFKHKRERLDGHDEARCNWCWNSWIAMTNGHWSEIARLNHKFINLNGRRLKVLKTEQESQQIQKNITGFPSG
jgi:hypothetical protein